MNYKYGTVKRLGYIMKFMMQKRIYIPVKSRCSVYRSYDILCKGNNADKTWQYYRIRSEIWQDK